MLEQRLTREEHGVAVRKVSSSGKAQLRSLRCVLLRPPSSSDFEEGPPAAGPAGAAAGGIAGRTGGPGGTPHADAHAGGAGVGRRRVPVVSVSVSSKSSTVSRFRERIQGS